MKFNAFAFLFLMPGFSPEKNTITMEEAGFRFKAVGLDMDDKARCVEVAKKLAEEGYQMIEMCGGFGPDWISKVTEALEGKVPVGGVFYGPAFRQPLADLLK